MSLNSPKSGAAHSTALSWCHSVVSLLPVKMYGDGTKYRTGSTQFLGRSGWGKRGVGVGGGAVRLRDSFVECMHAYIN